MIITMIVCGILYFAFICLVVGLCRAAAWADERMGLK